MRITFLLPSDNLTGGARVVAVHAQGLLAMGHEVLVVTCAPGLRPWRERLRATMGLGGRAIQPAAEGHIALSGVPHKVMTRRGPIAADDVPDADFIVATWWETAVWMHSMPESKGHKVHLIQGYEIWQGAEQVPKVHAALRLPNTKITISRDLKQTIEDAMGPLGIEVVPNAVNPDQFNAPPRARQNPAVVGFVYAHARIKGADICAEACERAREHLPDLKVIAFGTDIPDAQVRLPEGTAYFLRPDQDQLRNHYGACDVWLFGSRLDSFGLPILEAMACRTPVIAVPVGAATDLLSGGAGYIVPSESPQRMAEAIVHACRQPGSEWQRMSDLAHATAHSYTWRDATRKFVEILAGSTESRI